MKIAPELVAAYKDTNYCVSAPDTAFILRIGHASEEAEKLMAASSAEGAVFVTAWNPFSQVSTPTDNDKANRVLKDELDKIASTVLSGIGSSPDGQFQEDSFFALPISRFMAMELCVRHDQNAVVFVHPNGLPELIFHPNIDASSSQNPHS